jgi:hypothetical protein
MRAVWRYIFLRSNVAKVVYAKLSLSSPASGDGDIYLAERIAKFFF